MKKWIVLIAVLGIGFAGYSIWNRKPGTTQAAPLENARPTTAVISPRDIRFVVNAAGDIGPDDMVSVRPEINGRISELPVDIGDEVKKGDLLCALDDRDLQTTRASTVTDVEGAKLQLEQAQRNYERSKHLHDDNLISLEEFQDAQTAYELAKNGLERAQRALDQVDDQLSKTRIVAPFDCTILTRPVSIGQAVSGSAGYNSGTEIMTIANLKEMIITAYMNQADVIRLKTGQKVNVQVQAVPGLNLVGTVERIAPQATLKNNIKGFATQIRLKNIDPRVRPGMTANMTIPVASADNVLAIPIAAVFTDQGGRYAYVKTGEQEYEMRPIELGISDYEFAQVIGGLSDGDVVSLVRPDVDAVVKMPSEKSVGKVATLNSSAAESTR
ncbi:MAG TPA: efflux RND transporter periplasmic adaptor subunit [Verrucomicrobiae bacterium]|jgi:RND family efflux transporter MFP subunit|nr:efflux RND transporter periplasmic adaptor subunit [Verrucomicrobiae bacterium]